MHALLYVHICIINQGSKILLPECLIKTAVLVRFSISIMYKPHGPHWTFHWASSISVCFNQDLSFVQTYIFWISKNLFRYFIYWSDNVWLVNVISSPANMHVSKYTRVLTIYALRYGFVRVSISVGLTRISEVTSHEGCPFVFIGLMKCSYITSLDGKKICLNKKLHTVMMYGDKTLIIIVLFYVHIINNK